MSLISRFHSIVFEGGYAPRVIAYFFAAIRGSCHRQGKLNLESGRESAGGLTLLFKSGLAVLRLEMLPDV